MGHMCDVNTFKEFFIKSLFSHVGAAIGRPPKAKLPFCGKPPGAQRTERAPNGRPYGGFGKQEAHIPAPT